MFDSSNTFLSINNEDFLYSLFFERDFYSFHVYTYEWMNSVSYHYYFYHKCYVTFLDVFKNVFYLVSCIIIDYEVVLNFFVPDVLRVRNFDSLELCLKSYLHCNIKVSVFSDSYILNIYFVVFLYTSCMFRSRCDLCL